jgi:hypothetical protein
MKKLLYTYFFGYAAYKFRRLFRTLIILIACFYTLAAYYACNRVTLSEFNTSYNFDVIEFLLLIIPFPLIIALISFLIEPFVVKKKSYIDNNKCT